MEAMRSARRVAGMALFAGAVFGCGDSSPEQKNEDAGGGGVGAGTGGGSGKSSGGSTSTGGSGAAGTGGTVSTGGSNGGSGANSAATGGSATGGGATGGGSGSAGTSSMDYVPPDTIIGGACTGTPEPSTMPCAFGPEQMYCSVSDPAKVIMAVCSTSGRTQCESVEECEVGWHACTATDYVARGGRDVAPNFSATNRAWLAACARDLGDVGLKNEACGSCNQVIDFEPVVQWWCDGDIVYEGGMSGDTLGVHTNAECMRVGENTAGHGAFWTMDFTGGGGNFVVCCSDEI
jgi:hypothetical protein